MRTWTQSELLALKICTSALNGRARPTSPLTRYTLDNDEDQLVTFSFGHKRFGRRDFGRDMERHGIVWDVIAGTI